MVNTTKALQTLSFYEFIYQKRHCNTQSGLPLIHSNHMKVTHFALTYG